MTICLELHSQYGHMHKLYNGLPLVDNAYNFSHLYPSDDNEIMVFFLVVFVCLFIFIDNNGNAPNKLPTINIQLTFQLNILLRPYTFNNIWQNYDWFANYINQFFFQNSFKRYHTFKPKRLSAMVKWNVNCPPVVHLRDVNERVSYIRLLKLFTTMAFEIVYKKKKTRKKSEYVIFVWIKLLFLFDRIYWTRDLQKIAWIEFVIFICLLFAWAHVEMHWSILNSS